ncbi:MAG: hypothetical protein ACT4QF_14385 [Sporichthyaceae bacterium]
MNDDHVIDLLRSAATNGGDSDLGPAMRAGNRIRRRRRIAQAASGSAGLASVVALGLFVPGMGGPNESVVVAPPAATSNPIAGPSRVAAWDGQPRTWEEGQEVNHRLLEEAFGPDFERAKEGGELQLWLKQGTATAARLPDGYEAFASLNVVQAGLYVLYGPGEKYRLPDGRTVDLYRPRAAGRTPSPEELKVQGVRDGVGAMFTRADGSRVRVFLAAKDGAENSSPQRRTEALEFLESYVDTVATFAADRRWFPNDGEKHLAVPAKPTQEQLHQRYLQEALGDAWGTDVDSEGRITLQPDSDSAGELPSSDYQGKASLQILTRAQFEAACDAKPGAEACNWQKLGDGNVVHWRAWADRDASEDTMLGELATYYPRKDGSVVMAMASVLGRDVSAVERNGHRDGLFTWLESLRHQLIAAALDRRIGQDGSTTK